MRLGIRATCWKPNGKLTAMIRRPNSHLIRTGRGGQIFYGVGIRRNYDMGILETVLATLVDNNLCETTEYEHGKRTGWEHTKLFHTNRNRLALWSQQSRC